MSSREFHFIWLRSVGVSLYTNILTNFTYEAPDNAMAKYAEAEPRPGLLRGLERDDWEDFWVYTLEGE